MRHRPRVELAFFALLVFPRSSLSLADAGAGRGTERARSRQIQRQPGRHLDRTAATLPRAAAPLPQRLLRRREARITQLAGCGISIAACKTYLWMSIAA
jgi:hypothetical protein